MAKTSGIAILTNSVACNQHSLTESVAYNQQFLAKSVACNQQSAEDRPKICAIWGLVLSRSKNLYDFYSICGKAAKSSKAWAVSSTSFVLMKFLV